MGQQQLRGAGSCPGTWARTCPGEPGWRGLFPRQAWAGQPCVPRAPQHRRLGLLARGAAPEARWGLLAHQRHTAQGHGQPPLASVERGRHPRPGRGCRACWLLGGARLTVLGPTPVLSATISAAVAPQHCTSPPLPLEPGTHRPASRSVSPCVSWVGARLLAPSARISRIRFSSVGGGTGQPRALLGGRAVPPYPAHLKRRSTWQARKG